MRCKPACSVIVALASLCVRGSSAQMCPTFSEPSGHPRQFGATLDVGEGYATIDGGIALHATKSLFISGKAGFTYSTEGPSGPLIEVGLSYRGLAGARGKLRFCPEFSIRHDHGFEASTDFSLGVTVAFALGKIALRGRLAGVYDRYSLRKDRFAKGQEVFGVVEIGIGLPISRTFVLLPGIRWYPGYAWGRRPSLILGWSNQ